MKNIDTPEFKAWFQNSHIVDEHGDPLVVYHGTGDVKPILDLKSLKGSIGNPF